MWKWIWSIEHPEMGGMAQIIIGCVMIRALQFRLSRLQTMLFVVVS